MPSAVFGWGWPRGLTAPPGAFAHVAEIWKPLLSRKNKHSWRVSRGVSFCVCLEGKGTGGGGGSGERRSARSRVLRTSDSSEFSPMGFQVGAPHASSSKPMPTLCPPALKFLPSIRAERVTFTPAAAQWAARHWYGTSCQDNSASLMPWDVLFNQVEKSDLVKKSELHKTAITNSEEFCVTWIKLNLSLNLRVTSFRTQH